MSKLLPLTLAFTVATCNVTLCDAADRPAKPNVVLILVDDLGWQDVGCYDIDEACPFETPNMDRLASQGIKFWQAYSPAPTCAPSRAAILSGKHPARTQKTHVVGGAPPSPYTINSPLISPWYSGRMLMSEVTIAEALNTNGYTTGHAGKWHVAINHHAAPTPADQGFAFTRMNIGVTKPMQPNRLKGFATDAQSDRFQLDKNGFPRDQNTDDALEFLAEHKSEPFFLFDCTWLVHTPIHTRSEALLKKYCAKMNVPFPSNPKGWKLPGQQNPYYAAMVEMLDYYVGNVTDYLDETEDPRWPGHKLSENTYVIFTSDNGGMEQVPGEIITDNFPLDKGKINAKEGGVRVPLIIRGPGIAAGEETNAMANGLDFYPTILEWTGTAKSKVQQLDGLSLAKFLKSDSLNADLIVDAAGKPRDTMTWHFPHSTMQSTIRQRDYKLIRNWSGYLLPNRPALELYRLYGDNGQRVDIEEAHNLAESMPEKAIELNDLLESHLVEMKASPPYLNPTCRAKLFAKQKVCTPIENGRDGNRVWTTFQENGAKVVAANLIYTSNGGDKYEEWYRLPALVNGDQVSAELPTDATHYVFNLIDQNQYLVSYPAMKEESDRSEQYSQRAFSTN